jgi:hypothetical protein
LLTALQVLQRLVSRRPPKHRGLASRLPRSVRASHPIVEATCTARRDIWEVRLFETMAGDHGATGCWNTLGTPPACQDIQDNAAITDQVDVEVDRGLRELGFEPEGSTDVVASQRPGLVPMSIAAYQSHGELSKRIALEGLDPLDFIFGQILLSRGPQPAGEIVGEKEG